MPIAPPPPSKQYLASVGKNPDGSPVDVEPDANVAVAPVITSIILGLILTAGWIRLATGFHSFLTVDSVCGSQSDEIELSLVARLFRCNTGTMSLLATLWKKARDLAVTRSKTNRVQTGAKTMILAPIVYGITTWLSSFVGGMGTARLTYDYFSTPDNADVVDEFVDAIPGIMLGWKIVGVVAAFWMFFIGMIAVPLEIAIRALAHLFMCDDCGPASMTFGAGMMSYAFMAATLLGGLQSAVTGDDAVVPIVAIVLLIISWPVCSYVFAPLGTVRKFVSKISTKQSVPDLGSTPGSSTKTGGRRQHR